MSEDCCQAAHAMLGIPGFLPGCIGAPTLAKARPVHYVYTLGSKLWRFTFRGTDFASGLLLTRPGGLPRGQMDLFLQPNIREQKKQLPEL